jgi:hypothetical protein
MGFKTVTEQRNSINILSMYGQLPKKKVENTQSETLVKAVVGKTRSGKEVFNMVDESYINFTKVDHKFATELCKAQGLVEEVEYHKERYNELQKSEAYNELKDQFDMLIKAEPEVETSEENINQ